MYLAYQRVDSTFGTYYINQFCQFPHNVSRGPQAAFLHLDSMPMWSSDQSYLKTNACARFTFWPSKVLVDVVYEISSHHGCSGNQTERHVQYEYFYCVLYSRLGESLDKD